MTKLILGFERWVDNHLDQIVWGVVGFGLGIVFTIFILISIIKSTS